MSEIQGQVDGAEVAAPVEKKARTHYEIKHTADNPLKLTVSGVLADLEAGVNRKAMAEKYGVTFAELNRVIKSNPKLKGVKATFTRSATGGGKRRPTIILEDDTVEQTEGGTEVAVATDAEVAQGQPEIQQVPEQPKVEQASTTESQENW